MSDLVRRADVLAAVSSEWQAAEQDTGTAIQSLRILTRAMEALPAAAPSPLTSEAACKAVFGGLEIGLRAAQDAAPDPVQAAALALAEDLKPIDTIYPDESECWKCPACQESWDQYFGVDPWTNESHTPDCPLVAFRRARKGRTT